MTARTLVVEDEPLARDRLRRLLAVHDWVDVVGEAADGGRAVDAIDALRPDLVLLDVELPELDGLGVLRRVRHRPAVVFTTAYDRYAVAAFEVAAVDYLLKPFGAERLAAALGRARARLPEAGRDFDRAAGALAAPRLLERLWVRHGGHVVPVLARDVQRLEAKGNYVALVAADGREFLVQVPIAELALRLDPARFVRVHRSHVVNLDFVEAMTPEGNAQLSLRLRDGTVLLASRAASKALRELQL